MTQIIDAYLGLNALRQAGYKSTATAIAELVDNSIEAEATEISIMAISNAELVGKRTTNQVKTIAVLDDGLGMPEEVLKNCLSMGWGTRLETRNGLGRFGFGLKGSSISQARKIEVYSWTKGQKVYRVVLDLDDVKNQKMQVLSKPEQVDLPVAVSKALSKKIKDHGTLVVWSKIDQIDFKRADTLVRRIDRDLCRVYRHFLDDDDTYGTKRDISVIHVDGDTNKVAETTPLLANDPLYVLTSNNLPEHNGKATNTYFEDPFYIDVEYDDRDGVKKGQIGFRFTIAKPEIQAMSGNSTVGRHYGENTGISFVRAGREIDFDNFGYLDRSDPRHRWWGIEVRFPPSLDELFGVTNNKQSVRNITKLDEDQRRAYNEEGEARSKEKVLLQIDMILTEKIDQMMMIIRSRRVGTRTEKKESNPVADKVNEDIVKNPTPTISEKDNKNKTDQEKLSERINLLIADDTSLTEEDAKEIAESTIAYKIDLSTAGWPGNLFLDRRSVANASVGIVNRDTEFFSQFWDYLETQNDRKGFEALEILLMAYIRAEDELCLKYDRKTFSDFRNKWGEWVEELIHHAGT